MIAGIGIIADAMIGSTVTVGGGGDGIGAVGKLDVDFDVAAT